MSTKITSKLSEKLFNGVVVSGSEVLIQVNAPGHNLHNANIVIASINIEKCSSGLHLQKQVSFRLGPDDKAYCVQDFEAKEAQGVVV